MFSKRLRELREAQHISQSELARRAGLTPQAINQLEAGSRWPREETVAKIATALRVQPAYLFSDPIPIVEAATSASATA